MPHLRARRLEQNIQNDLSWSPIVSILGMRQVGKSTLLRQIGKTYLALDDDAHLMRLEGGDWSEVEAAATPLVIDEAQKCPKLFDRLKLLSDSRKRPGQFLLTGSVRFLSRKQIRESLTGRTSLLDLLPLTLAEAHSRPLNDLASHAIAGKPERFLEWISGRRHFSIHDVESYREVGGLPGICFKRDASIRDRMRAAHLETLLMRDLQLLIQSRVPFVKLKAILSTLAQVQGGAVSLSAVARQVQLSTPTVIQHVHAFENLFILRRHGKSWHFTDCGMAGYLGAERVENPVFHLERFVFQELVAQMSYLHRAEHSFESWITRGGARVPFVLRVGKSPPIAITVDPSNGATEKSLKSLTWFAKGRKERVFGLVLHAGKNAYLSSSGIPCVPYHWIA